MSDIDKLGLHGWHTISGDDLGLDEKELELVWIAPYEPKWTTTDIASKLTNFAFAQLDSEEKWFRIMQPGLGWHTKRNDGEFQ